MSADMMKDIRLFLDMTQREFAKWLGVSLASVSMIECGQRSVSDSIKAKLAHKFEVTDDFLQYRQRKSKLIS